jgi:CDP-diacylglycerol--glycerol-3-phosphate 3-phosphatidyltransferase
LDPLADKIGVGVVSVVLVVRGLVPVWFVAFLVARDLLILSGGILLRVRQGVVLPSNTTGKWTVGVIAAALILGLLEASEEIQLTAQVLATAMGGVSLVLYGKAYAHQRSGEGAGS